MEQWLIILQYIIIVVVIIGIVYFNLIFVSCFINSALISFVWLNNDLAGKLLYMHMFIILMNYALNVQNLV